MEVTRYEVDMSEVSIFGTPKKFITVVQQAITSHTVHTKGLAKRAKSNLVRSSCV